MYNNIELAERCREEVARTVEPARAEGHRKLRLDELPMLAQWRWMHWVLFVDGKLDMGYELCLVGFHFIEKKQETMEAEVGMPGGV